MKKKRGDLLATKGATVRSILLDKELREGRVVALQDQA